MIREQSRGWFFLYQLLIPNFAQSQHQISSEQWTAAVKSDAWVKQLAGSSSTQSKKSILEKKSLKKKKEANPRGAVGTACKVDLVLNGGIKQSPFTTIQGHFQVIMILKYSLAFDPFSPIEYYYSLAFDYFSPIQYYYSSIVPRRPWLRKNAWLYSSLFFLRSNIIGIVLCSAC